MENTNKNLNLEEEKNLNPLGKDEMNSVIKSFQESSFSSEKLYQNEKNLFVKKSLYDLAIDSEKNIDNELSEKNNELIDPENNENSQQLNETITPKDNDLEKRNLKDSEVLDKDLTIKDETIKDEYVDEKNSEETKNNVEPENKENAENKEETENKDIQESVLNSPESEDENNSIQQNESLISDDKDVDVETEKKQNFEEKTLDAMDSVREAVVKSLEKKDEVSSDEISHIQNDYDLLIQLFENIKNVSINEIEKNIKNKIYELSAEIAGYQIEKVPEKFFQKIKNVLLELNNLNDEIIIKLSEKDFKVLKNIDEKNIFNKNVRFQENPDLNRGEFSISAGGLLHSVIYSSEKK